MQIGNEDLVPVQPEIETSTRDKGRWSDFYVRMASALVLGPLVLFCLYYGGIAWNLLIAVAMAGLGHEWGKLSKLQHAWPLAGVLLIIWACMLFSGFNLAFQAIIYLSVAVWLVFGRMAAAGVPYAGFGGVLLIWLRHRPEVGFIDASFLILVIWGTDIGAYLAGRLLGGPKLAPRISPGKTWSGALGGLLAGAVIGLSVALVTKGSLFHAFGAGLLVSLCAQFGDLMESVIKRKLGVKDSGRTIPGHGGLFDRLDGFLTAVPLAALLAACVQGGMALWG